jgi:hypothetical protein
LRGNYRFGHRQHSTSVRWLAEPASGRVVREAGGIVVDTTEDRAARTRRVEFCTERLDKLRSCGKYVGLGRRTNLIAFGTRPLSTTTEVNDGSF